MKQIFDSYAKPDFGDTTEIALNTHGRTLAIYTKDENDAVVQLAGKGVPFLDTSGTLSVDGIAIANPASETYTDVFKVDADGNQTVYGNSAVSRALTVSSTATINGVIYQ
ncbi:hypothetical protein vBKpnAMK6_00466 [Klebsiella phage vB_Kpn_AM_K6]